ncbi:MAG: adenylate/guanylate cyclase domain-containing protein, partial [Pseudomonadota bacterium]
RMTPLEQSMPGVEVHAQLIDAILTYGLLHRPAEMVGAEHLAAILIAALLIWRLPRLSALGGAPLAFGAVAAVWAGSYAAFAYGSTALDPTYPSLVAIAVYGVLAYSAYARAEAQRRAIRSAFTQYLSPDMVSRLAEDPDALKLGGESREMTFLFCDIAGFTSFVERAEPEALVRLLNEYLEGVCGIVMRSGGTVDKIVGDAVHAMYNAPLDDPDHAANAVRAALEIEAFVDDFRARKAAEGIDFGRTRVGVNTGPAIVGNFGGDSRFDYTAHGDAINTAARLESVNKHLGTTICVAGSTAALCPDLAFRPIGTLYLKGKDKGVETFTPLRPEAAEDPVMIAYARVFERMAENAPRDETLSAFDALAEQSPSDPLIALHAQRLRAGGVGPDIRMTEK